MENKTGKRAFLTGNHDLKEKPVVVTIIMKAKTYRLDSAKNSTFSPRASPATNERIKTKLRWLMIFLAYLNNIGTKLKRIFKRHFEKQEFYFEFLSLHRNKYNNS